MAVLHTTTFTYKMCDDGYQYGGYTYTRWLLRMVVNITSETSTDVAGNVEVHFIRDTNATAGGYNFSNGNYFCFKIGGQTIVETQNLGTITIPGGTYYDKTIWSGTWTGKKDSSGVFSQTFSATFNQTQRSNPWSGTVGGTFTVQPESNVFVYVNNAWHRGTAYVYNGGWKKAKGKVSIYNGGWKS